MSSKGMFDQLNEALFAQLDKLQSVRLDDAEQVERVIEQSRAVSQLASNINANMANAVRVSRLLAEEGMDVSGMKATMPRMLGGGE